MDSVWTVDHWVGWFPEGLWTTEFSHAAAGGGSTDAYYDWQVLAGALASRVGTMQLAVGVTESLRRHPLLLAQAALTLSHLTKRPPILGIGAGEAENVVPYGVAFDTPVGHLEEALQIIRLAFTSQGRFAFDGTHWAFDRAIMDLQPGPAGPPEIWVAAHGPRMLRLTGTYADGWYPVVANRPEVYGEWLGVIRDAAAAAGRDRDAVTPGLSLFHVVAPTKDAAWAALDSPPVKFFALMAPDSVWQRHGVTHPLGTGFGGLVDYIPQDVTAQQIWSAMHEVPREFVAEEMAWGTPEMIVDHLRDMADVGMRQVTLVPLSALASRQLRNFVPKALWAVRRGLR